MAVERTYGSLALRDGHWVMDAVEPHVSIRLKQLFPRLRKADAPPYHFPDEPGICADLDWFLDRYPLAAAANDLVALRSQRTLFEERQAEVERLFAPGYVPRPLAGLRDGQALRMYQSQLVDLVRLSKRVLCADVGGLGKTYEAGGCFLLPGALPAVAVCYPHLQGQWQDKIESFTNLRCHLINTTKPYLVPASKDVLIFRWSQLLGWADAWAAMDLKSAAYDECQELRTGTGSQRGVSAKRLAEVCEYVVGLTATPIYNWGTEIWNVYDVLGRSVLGTREEFGREWCGGSASIQDPKALGTFLREQQVFIRRTREDVGQELPPVSKIVEVIDHDAEALASVEDLAHQLAVRATTAEFTERGQAVRELDMLLRHATGVAKAKQVAQFVRMIVEGGERVLVAGWHRDVYDIWLRELKDLEPCMYTGSESPAQKERERERFISGDPKPMFMSLRSGAGLDGIQQHCSVVIIGELDWSPGVHQQFIWRIDREGQTKPVTVIYLVTNDGSDPPMMEVNGLKASEAAQIMDPHKNLLSGLATDDSPLQRLVSQYLTKTKKKSA